MFIYDFFLLLQFNLFTFLFLSSLPSFLPNFLFPPIFCSAFSLQMLFSFPDLHPPFSFACCHLCISLTFQSFILFVHLFFHSLHFRLHPNAQFTCFLIIFQASTIAFHWPSLLPPVVSTFQSLTPVLIQFSPILIQFPAVSLQSLIHYHFYPISNNCSLAYPIFITQQYLII